eukprot:5393034-Alexandrium_andersonii.AAC.1
MSESLGTELWCCPRVRSHPDTQTSLSTLWLWQGPPRFSLTITRQRPTCARCTRCGIRGAPAS